MDVTRFSASGDLLSACGSDGHLRLWETKDKNCTFKQEFIPSAHLSAKLTCISWAPSSTGYHNAHIRKKKKKRGFEGEVLAIGTSAGAIFFYSFTKSELLAQTKEGHSGPISGLVWNPSTLSLYSCGEDGFIIEWDTENVKPLSRWKGDKGGLSSICMFEDMLLVAGRKMTLWNLETKTSVMTFMGHTASISQLEPIPKTDYFATMSVREMHLQIWSKSEKSSVATLTLMEYPRHFCVGSTIDGKVAVAVVTENGTLCTFQHKLNGPLRKPLAPGCVFKITETNDPSIQIPVLTAFLSTGEDNLIKLVYGSWLSLRFEVMEFKFLQDTVTIKRDFNIKSKVSKNKKRNNLVEVTEIPSDAKHLQPGSEADLKTGDGKSKKRKKNEKDPGGDGDSGELPMEDRLSNLTIDKPSSGIIPDGNNLAHLLSQGLHSKDSKILQSVLSRWDQDVIENTVRSLPVQMVVPLLNEVKKMLSNKPMLNHSVVKWLKTIFKIHSAFLMTCPSSEDLLGPFMSLLHSRETLYPQMCQLKGKLELIKGNIQSKEHKAEVPNEALLVYHDESSDHGEEDDMIPSESEEFIESDDLVEDDEKSGGSDSEEDSDKIEESSAEESDSDEEVKSTSNSKKDKNLSKVNGNVNSDEESMDED